MTVLYEFLLETNFVEFVIFAYATVSLLTIAYRGLGFLSRLLVKARLKRISNEVGSERFLEYLDSDRNGSVRNRDQVSVIGESLNKRKQVPSAWLAHVGNDLLRNSLNDNHVSFREGQLFAFAMLIDFPQHRSHVSEYLERVKSTDLGKREEMYQLFLLSASILRNEPPTLGALERMRKSPWENLGQSVVEYLLNPYFRFLSFRISRYSLELADLVETVVGSQSFSSSNAELLAKSKATYAEKLAEQEERQFNNRRVMKGI
jgi:hypothetical protein